MPVREEQRAFAEVALAVLPGDLAGAEVDAPQLRLVEAVDLVLVQYTAREVIMQRVIFVDRMGFELAARLFDFDDGTAAVVSRGYEHVVAGDDRCGDVGAVVGLPRETPEEIALGGIDADQAVGGEGDDLRRGAR